MKIIIFVPNIWGCYQVALLSLGGEGTISKSCVQFNIIDSVMIFVANIWGSYQVGLLFEGGRVRQGTSSQYQNSYLDLAI